MWQRGTIERIQYTSGGAGNQWTTISGTRYATYFNWDTFQAREGIEVEFWPHMARLWSGSPEIPHAAVRNVAPLTDAIRTIESGAYKVLPWFEFALDKGTPAELVGRAKSIVAECFEDIQREADARDELRRLHASLPDQMEAQRRHYRKLRDLWVLFDDEASADGDSYMLVGNDPEALAREAIEHLELEPI